MLVANLTRDDNGGMADAKRGRSSAWDMVRSLAVVALAAGFLVFFSFREQPQYSVPNVDVQATVEAARKNVDFPVLALRKIPPNWRANAAYLEPVRGADSRWTYHVGYVTDRDQYFGVDATNQVDLTGFINGYLFGTETGETRTVAGLRFTVYENEKQRMWLHRGVADVPYAIIITGAGDGADFEIFARMLSAG